MGAQSLGSRGRRRPATPVRGPEAGGSWGQKSSWALGPCGLQGPSVRRSRKLGRVDFTLLMTLPSPALRSALRAPFSRFPDAPGPRTAAWRPVAWGDPHPGPEPPAPRPGSRAPRAPLPGVARAQCRARSVSPPFQGARSRIAMRVVWLALCLTPASRVLCAEQGRSVSAYRLVRVPNTPLPRSPPAPEPANLCLETGVFPDVMGLWQGHRGGVLGTRGHVDAHVAPARRPLGAEWGHLPPLGLRPDDAESGHGSEGEYETRFWRTRRGVYRQTGPRPEFSGYRADPREG